MNCEQCGAEFAPAKHQTGMQKFCSKRCRRASMQADAAPPKWKVCGAPGCTTIYPPKRKDSRYCSRQCGWRARRSLRRRATPILRTCKECNAEFIPAKNQLYCTTSCRAKASNRRYRTSEKNRRTLAENQRRWRARNPDYDRKMQARAYAKDPEKYRAKAREYYYANREEVLARHKVRRGRAA